MNIPLYIHIPFCESKCKYCDFYSVAYDESFAKTYISVLTDQLKYYRDQGFSFSTVYIGGGTPSVLSINLLKKLLSNFDNKVEEINFEANPDSLNLTKIKVLKELGVNRLSIGIQSLNDNILRLDKSKFNQ